MIPRKPRQTPTAAESGTVRLDGAVVHYAFRNVGSLAIPLDDVAVIGVFTTDNGPLIDDWFLVFVRKDRADWFEVSMYAEGIAELIHDGRQPLPAAQVR